MLKIGFILGNLQKNGGIGRVTSILAPELNKRDDLDVTVISYYKTNEPVLYEITEDVKQYSLFSSALSMTKAIIIHHAVKKLKYIIKKENLDIIVGCGALFYPLAILAARGTKAKAICWEHTNPATTSDYKFQDLARKFAVKKADSVFVLTKAAEKYYLETLKIKRDKLFQIYNPFSENAAKSTKYNSDSKKIISVGRLSYQKNFSLLVDIAAEVLPKHPEWTWDIYGTGEGHDPLMQKIEEKQLKGKVNLMGQVSDLYDRYGNYSFQVMTSRFEGFPMSLLEGAANRLPLVSFDIETGPSEIIEDGTNGFLIPSGDASLMVNKICTLIEDSELRIKMSDNSYSMVNRFSMNKTIDRWCELCQELNR